LKKITLSIILFFSSLILLRDYKEGITIHSERHQVEAVEYGEEEEEEGKRFDKPDAYLVFHGGIRTREGEAGPTYPAGYKWNELENSRNQLARKRTSGRTKTNGVIEWKERGPGNVPGRTRALLNVPGDPDNNTWLAGSATGGIWRTTDGGITWKEQSANFPALPISSFASNSSGSVIYAGTGEYISSIYSAMGNGIFKSEDQGVTWTQLQSTNNNANFNIVTRLIVDPANANNIVATSASHSQSKSDVSKILRSTDGGTTWSVVKESTTDVFEQIIASPGNFSIQYASQNGVGVWKSTDAGATWTLSNTGMQLSGRAEIAVSPSNPNKLYVSAVGISAGVNADLYVSTDAGATWGPVDVKFNNAAFDFFEGQGFYDNTILCDPFDDTKVYFGGVSLFRATVSNSPTVVNYYHMIPDNTESFMVLQQFSNILHDNLRLSVGDITTNIAVEVRFGPGRSQLAHRFLVPEGATSGVAAASYAYQDYVSIPCEVWDITNNRQLMVSFRDQNRNGKFDLVPAGFPEGQPLNHSREYFYVHNIAYGATAAPNVAVAGGHEAQMLYNFFPALAAGAVWNEATLPTSKLTIKNDPVSKFTSTLTIVADGRNSFGGKNGSNQQILSAGVHPDHHFMIPIIVNQASKNYKILVGNDGGIFMSNTAAEPGINNGDWQFKGMGYNTSQFYGVDKRPGADQYIGGMQDNGTRLSVTGENASATSSYVYGIGGDGFEAIWHSKDPSMVMGTIYNGQIQRSMNGGASWSSATSGLPAGTSEFPFVTKIASSKDFPDRVFTAGLQGVYRSNDFGANWALTPIPSNFVAGSSFYLDVEVSRANPNIVWAGSGMASSPSRKLHVSTNGGTTFTATNNYTAVTLGSITKLASHPSQPNTAYALFSFSEAPKILRTTDLGNTWEDISGFGTGTSSTNGFPDVAVYCLYVRPDNPDIIWAGTEIGIVESQDNGASWTLLEDFPNVSVWDMKGQDNQIVIATHGRGIWTATIGASQSASKSAEIIAAGTSPDEKLVVRIAALENYDSVDVYIDNVFERRIYNVNTGSRDETFAGKPAGTKNVKLLSYKGPAPAQSATHTVMHIDLLNAVNSYSNYFNTLTEVSLSNLIHQTFSVNAPTRKALHTPHNYQTDKIYEVILKKPVIISNSLSSFHYSDIAIVEPADKIVVQATKNGIDWITLHEHDASVSPDWQSTLNSGGLPTSTMFVDHEFDLKEKLTPGDLVVFRLQMRSNATTTAWGWALNWVSIQEAPVATEPTYSMQELTVFPNPSKGSFKVDFNLQKGSEVAIRVVDMYGRTVQSKALGWRKPGQHSEPVNLEHQENGTYVVLVTTGEGKRVSKISVLR
jgi:photosystem II stability/assembly factor-like uncharacterized protein